MLIVGLLLSSPHIRTGWSEKSSGLMLVKPKVRQTWELSIQSQPGPIKKLLFFFNSDTSSWAIRKYSSKWRFSMNVSSFSRILFVTPWFSILGFPAITVSRNCSIFVFIFTLTFSSSILLFLLELFYCFFNFNIDIRLKFANINEVCDGKLHMFKEIVEWADKMQVFC